MDKTGRNGLRVGDTELPDFLSRYEKLKQKHLDLLQLYGIQHPEIPGEQDWLDAVATLKQLPFVDGEYYINDALKAGKRVLAEGAQGSMLDVDHGTYPFVTSSNTITAGVCTGLGIAPSSIGEVIGITKAYCTRVGSGPFPTELFDEDGEKLRRIGSEFGATTGRPRRCGWIDLPALRYTIMLNGVTQLALTKVDVLNAFSTIKACTGYTIGGKASDAIPYDLTGTPPTPEYLTIEGWNCDFDIKDGKAGLPDPLQSYLAFLERELGVRISMMSAGPERDKLMEC